MHRRSLRLDGNGSGAGDPGAALSLHAGDISAGRADGHAIAVTKVHDMAGRMAGCGDDAEVAHLVARAQDSADRMARAGPEAIEEADERNVGLHRPAAFGGGDVGGVAGELDTEADADGLSRPLMIGVTMGQSD